VHSQLTEFSRFNFLLGKPVDEVFKIYGPPHYAYEFREVTQYAFLLTGVNNLLVCNVDRAQSRIVAVNGVADRRRHPRVAPFVETWVTVLTSTDDVLIGTLVDVSASGIALQLEPESLSKIQKHALCDLRMTIHISKHVSQEIVLPGVFLGRNKDNKAPFILTSTTEGFKTREEQASYAALIDFISFRLSVSDEEAEEIAFFVRQKEAASEN